MWLGVLGWLSLAFPSFIGSGHNRMLQFLYNQQQPEVSASGIWQAAFPNNDLPDPLGHRLPGSLASATQTLSIILLTL